MGPSREIVEPTETIHTPAPSWAPVIFAFGVLGLLASIYAAGFMFPRQWYGWVGAVFVIGALISFARQGRRNFYSLPRRQEAVPGEIPVESFRAPTKPE